MAVEIDHPAILGIGSVLPDSDPIPIVLPDGLGDLFLAFQCDVAPGKGILPSGALRRLGRAQRMAMTATHLALEDAGLDVDSRENVAVCVGTAWGELGHTYAFLENMIKQDEQKPKPASFVNSVHNAIAGQIAITLKCTGENHTTIHSSISFENALWQAKHILNQNRADAVVVCAVDELNGYIVAAEHAFGRLPLVTAAITEHGCAPGSTIPGEGAVAIVLGKVETSNNIRIHTVKTRPWSPSRIDSLSREPEVAFIQNTLKAANVEANDIDLVVCNMNGNPEQTTAYHEIMVGLSACAQKDIPYSSFQHATGDFRTAAAAGLALSIDSLKKSALSPELRCHNSDFLQTVRTILNYSLYPTGFQSACVVSR